MEGAHPRLVAPERAEHGLEDEHRDEPWVGAFHGLNALVVMAVAGTLARASWEAARGGGAGAATAAPR